jgi:UDP-2,3-diacylglucosamine pyrophosphatase LpxH
MECLPMTTVHTLKPLKYRAIWLSDIHLGYRGCKAEYLLDFLKTTESDVLYLVGDIIDLWSMKRTMFWPQAHNNVIRTILGKAKHGTRIIYIPGNHDEQIRDFVGSVFGDVEIHDEYVHVSMNGKRFRVLHGDVYDALMQCSGLKSFIGNKAYDLIMFLNRHVYKLRQMLGYPYWSLASFLKWRVKDAVAHIRKFEEIVAADSKKLGYDGVICGHIHHAEMREVNEVMYCNDGDWVEHCTALVEDREGRMELLHWSDKRQILYAAEAGQIQPLAAA